MALWRDGAVTSTTHQDPRSHAERLPVEAMAWLGTQGVTLGDLDHLAVVAGPGSFTGLRVGVAATQGWSFAGGTPVILVPTLDAVAADPAVTTSSGRLIVPMVDGQRGEVFYAAWRDGIELGPAAAARPADAIAAVAAAFPGEPVFAIGDGTVRYGAEVDSAGWARLPSSVPLAESAVRLAAAGGYRSMPPHALRPIYVRRPDAEVLREKRGPSS
jgi:tRNA threonylcarbamoyladenosine biosynthesis protein TsaB